MSENEWHAVSYADLKRKDEQEFVRKLMMFGLNMMDKEGLQMPDRIKIEMDFGDEQCAAEGYAPGVEQSEEFKNSADIFNDPKLN